VNKAVFGNSAEYLLATGAGWVAKVTGEEFRGVNAPYAIIVRIPSLKWTWRVIKIWPWFRIDWAFFIIVCVHSSFVAKAGVRR
jgi:hypothetical protein